VVNWQTSLVVILILKQNFFEIFLKHNWYNLSAGRNLKSLTPKDWI